MTLIKSISGIRGTIGGPAGDTLNPLDIVKFTSAYATLIRKTTKVDVSDDASAISWLIENGHPQCYKVPAPEISKTEVKKLLATGAEIPGVALVQDYSCSLR